MAKRQKPQDGVSVKEVRKRCYECCGYQDHTSETTWKSGQMIRHKSTCHTCGKCEDGELVFAF